MPPVQDTTAREYLAHCRFCGQPGIETPFDAAPGVCPRCLDERLARVLRRFRRAVRAFREGEIDGDALIGWYRALLLGAGLTRASADALIDTTLSRHGA